MLETMKKHKYKLLLSSAIILLPMAAGLLLWERLPEQMATHWDFSGEPNGWSSRSFAVFGLPLLMLALNWVCLLAEQGNFSRNPKPMWLVFWICPAVSVFCGTLTYAYALGYDLHIETFAPVMLGAMLIAIGNYLPKCRQNYTLGIKLKWTFESEENWNATHRMAGKVWVAAGAVTMLCAFLPESVSAWIVVPVILGAVLVPTVYSYLYSRRNGQTGEGEDA